MQSVAPVHRPILLEPRLDSRLWGGDRLAGWMGLSQAPSPLAEAWLVYEDNVIREGEFAGQTLRTMARSLGEALVGTRSFARSGAEFPLLAKLIDAKERLSIQVHPDDDFAHQFEADTGYHGKTEAWYVLEADAGGDVFLGFDRQVEREQVRTAALDGSLEQLLKRVPVTAGTTLFVPARTVHGINGGTMLFEIQQKSDLTYRLYDYGRRGPDGKLRPLHLEKGLQVADLAESPPPTQETRGSRPWATSLVSCPYFGLERWNIDRTVSTATDPASFEILVPIAGAVSLRSSQGTVTLARGQAVVLPARFGEYELSAQGPAQLLRCYVP